MQLFFVALVFAAIARAVPQPYSNELRSFSGTTASAQRRQEGPSNNQTYMEDVPIHSSCNATQAAQIQAGLDDMKELAQVTIDHVLRNGRDELFTTYFGATGDTSPVIGILTQILSANKQGMVIRCDDPDEKCSQPGWNGYWRTEPEFQAETNICEASFFTRRRLAQVCGLGWTVAGSNSNLFWGADFLHRLWVKSPSFLLHRH